MRNLAELGGIWRNLAELGGTWRNELSVAPRLIKEQCDVPNRNKRSKMKLNNLRICFVRVENEILDVSCNSSLFICFMKE